MDNSIRFRFVPGYPKYMVGSDGSVWSLKGKEPRRLKESASSKGYRTVGLRRDRQSHTFKVHRLVLLAFVGPCPEGQQTRHLDGDPANNAIGNLAYGTAKDNAADRIRHGTSNVGSRHGLAKLTEADIPPIREALAAGERQQSIADRYGVSNQTISFIATGRTWRHVTSEVAA